MSADVQIQQWPALMRARTLRAYLDCGSDSDFSRMMKRLERVGYPGPSPATGRHVKAVIDRYIDPQLTEDDPDEQAARKALAGFRQ